jgi:hypothetical protein
LNQASFYAPYFPWLLAYLRAETKKENNKNIIKFIKKSYDCELALILKNPTSTHPPRIEPEKLL